jgi:hypothetical protein
MKKISFLLLMQAAGCLSLASTAGKSEKDLMLSCDAIFIQTNKEATEGVFPIRLHIENISNTSKSIPLGVLLKSISSESIIYSFHLPRTSSGGLIKPSPSEVNIITLDPRETTSLKGVNIEIKRARDFSRRIVYSVEKEINEFYNTWTGSIEIHVDEKILNSNWKED